MNQQRKEELQQKRMLWQKQQEATEFYNSTIAPITELLHVLEAKGSHFSIAGFDGNEKELLPYFTTENKQSLRELLNNSDEEIPKVLDLLFQKYPSVNPLRYVPNLPLLGNATHEIPLLNEAIESLKLPDQEVYLYYLRYVPVLQLPLYDLLHFTNDDVFDPWHGDLVIFPKDLNWLIALTLESDWYAGKADSL